MNKLKICSKCIYDETVPNIQFNPQEKTKIEIYSHFLKFIK